MATFEIILTILNLTSGLTGCKSSEFSFKNPESAMHNMYEISLVKRLKSRSH